MSESAATPRQTAGILTVFASVWLLFVGTFTLILVDKLSKQLDAARRFKPAQATITYNREEAERAGIRSAAPGPELLYEYEVAGRRYESSRHSFDTGIMDGHPIASRHADRYRQGATVTAWYDPHAPSTSVLENGESASLMFWFWLARPFWGVGILLLLWVAIAWSHPSRVGRFLNQALRLPCRVPGWGIVKKGAGVVVWRWPNLFLSCVAAYSGAAFLSAIVLLASDKMFDPDAQRFVKRGCLGVALAAGLVGLALARRFAISGDTVIAGGIFRTEEVPLNQVASVELRGDNPSSLDLVVVGKDGCSLTANRFSLKWQNRAVASRARDMVAELLGSKRADLS